MRYAVWPARLIPPKILETGRRQLGVPHRVLNILVAEICLQSPGVDALVRQRVATRMPEHVRMRLEAELGLLSRAFDHPGKTRCGEWRVAFRCEHESRFGLLLPKPAECPQFVATDRVRAWHPLLQPTHMQRP